MLEDQVHKLIEEHRGMEGPLLPLLHAVQERFGHIPAEVEAEVASALNLSAAEVRGVVSFYHDFRVTPRGRHRVQICCAEACQARGSRTLVGHALASLDIGFGATTGNGGITLEKVYCLGNCACGPSVAVDGEVHANVDATRFDEIIAELCPEDGQ